MRKKKKKKKKEKNSTNLVLKAFGTAHLFGLNRIIVHIVRFEFECDQIGPLKFELV